MTRSNISLTKTGKFGPNGVLVNAIGSSVQLRQTITSPELEVGRNQHNDTLGALSATRVLPGLDSTRTCLIPVAAGTTAEQVEQYLAGHPAACLYTMRSTDVRDLLGANQLAALAPNAKNPRTIAQFEADHTVTNPATGEVMPYFSATYFSLTAKDDVDFRRSAAASPAASLAQAAAAAPAAPVASEVDADAAL